MWIGFAVFASIILFAAWVDSRREMYDSRLRELLGMTDQLLELDTRREKKAFRGFLKRLQKVAGRMAPAQALESIEKRLMWAGMPRGLTAEEFYSAKLIAAAILFGVVSAVGMVGSGLKSLVLGVLMGAWGYMLPDVWLNSLVAQRRRAIESQLLTFVDTLAVACEAGLSLKDAAERVAERYGGVLGGEFQRTFAEITLGRPAVEALEALGERNGVDDLRMLATALAQAERHGTPVAQVLHQQVRDIRTARRNRASEIAQKAAVKMLLPTVGCMFVPMMILLLGPAVVNLGSALGF